MTEELLTGTLNLKMDTSDQFQFTVNKKSNSRYIAFSNDLSLKTRCGSGAALDDDT